MLRSLGVALDGPALMLGDNMSVVLNTKVSSSVLKKKHNAIAYHHVSEAITSRIMSFAYIKSEENVSDVLTKLLRNEKFDYLLTRWLFRVPEKDKLSTNTTRYPGLSVVSGNVKTESKYSTGSNQYNIRIWDTSGVPPFDTCSGIFQLS
jgi:hypothetical protein